MPTDSSGRCVTNCCPKASRNVRYRRSVAVERVGADELGEIADLARLRDRGVELRGHVEVIGAGPRPRPTPRRIMRESDESGSIGG